MEKTNQSSNLLEVHNQLIANILTKFRTLIMLATSQAKSKEANHRREIVAVNGIAIRNEFEGLHINIKELLSLSRRLKELWLFGPLGADDPRSQERNEQTRQDALRVAQLINEIEARQMSEVAEKFGGVWEAMGGAVAGAGVSGTKVENGGNEGEEGEQKQQAQATS